MAGKYSAEWWEKSQISTVKFRHGMILQALLTISYRQPPVAGHLPSGRPSPQWQAISYDEI
jgi:hypothetical protein